ncbi:hypothetical protein [Actinomadura rudentiformis]|uniref:Uncharacterized protein n=1 Tax=Actinomadura rudentiformis TaxID=359158 RepID=A0A6H9Z0A1_9ACTN|nr:hypothetical protein [Actinomadura rudentiformis]KAB2347291.1 hypothetical protein F8566_19965 [Actinomadura rudentiformis]
MTAPSSGVPAHWPPQPGDVWAAHDGLHYFAQQADENFDDHGLYLMDVAGEVHAQGSLLHQEPGLKLAYRATGDTTLLDLLQALHAALDVPLNAHARDDYARGRLLHHRAIVARTAIADAAQPGADLGYVAEFLAQYMSELQASYEPLCMDCERYPCSCGEVEQ